MLILALLIVALFSGVAFLDWRRGLALSVAMAVLQDMMRKYTPDEPAFFNLFVAVVFAAALLGCLSRSRSLEIDRFAEKRSNFRLVLATTLLVIFLQTLHSLGRFGNPLVSLIGFANYLAPFLAIIFIAKLRKPLDFSEIQKFFWIYLLFNIPAVLTVYLQSIGVESRVLGEVGVGIWITDLGQVLQAYSGVYRASEVAAWHIFACSSLIVLMATYQRPTLGRSVMAILLVGILVYIGVFTGRRKFVVMVAIFIVSYAGLLLWSSKTHRNSAIALGFMAIIAFLAFGGERFDSVGGYTGAFDDRSQAELYLIRSSGVFGDIQERFLGLGIAPISWAYTRTGFFGAGVGVGTQGVQHLGGFGQLVGGAAEGGLGRLMVELGVPGLVLVGILVAMVVYRLLAAVTASAMVVDRDRRFFCGLVAFAIANVASYSIAQGMFGDMFVLLFNGVIFGTVLTYTRELQVLAGQKARQRRVKQSGAMIAAAR